MHKGWVTRLSAHLERFGQQHQCQILLMNASVNGNTTRLALERMPYEVQSQHPDLLLVQFGMNDCNFWESDGGVPRVSRKAFSANLEEIIARGRCFGAKRIALNTNHPTTRTTLPLGPTSKPYQQWNAAYNQSIRDVASLHEDIVTLNDIESSFEARLADGARLEDYLLPDGLHLSEAGHEVYFQEVCRVIECMLLGL